MSDCRSIELLIVEDDPDFRETCVRWMRRKGHNVVEAENGQKALHCCDQRFFDVAIVDLNMPGLSGLELLERLKSANVDTEVIILTGEATVETAVQAMKLGACDYLSKPFPLAELEQRCRLAFERGQIQKENRQLKALIERNRPEARMIGESPPMQDVFRLIERAGPTDKAILIQGESGTGKELVARAIQRCSRRTNKPFVTVNCAALPDQLVESELFGHEKGAFTGASNAKSGLFEVADGGTLFIDEIGELPPSIQPKLLRVLEDGSLRRVGSHKERRVDVRIVAATNRNLGQEVAAGNFREDLYYRINVMSLELPPLRERGADIGLLIDHILGPDWQIAPEARQALVEYHWPGNIRQLINAIERAKIMADDQRVTLDDLPQEIEQPLERPERPVTVGGLEKLDEIERAHVLDVLQRENGNKARAARALGIHRRKLYRLLERYSINLNEP